MACVNRKALGEPWCKALGWAEQGRGKDVKCPGGCMIKWKEQGLKVSPPPATYPYHLGRDDGVPQSCHKNSVE